MVVLCSDVEAVVAVVDVLLLRTLGFPPAFAAPLPAARRFETSYYSKITKCRKRRWVRGYMIITWPKSDAKWFFRQQRQRVDATYPQREAASVFTAVVSSLLLIHHGGGNRVDSAAVVGCCYGMIALKGCWMEWWHQNWLAQIVEWANLVDGFRLCVSQSCHPLRQSPIHEKVESKEIRRTW